MREEPVSGRKERPKLKKHSQVFAGAHSLKSGGLDLVSQSMSFPPA
jgi:hypothetical protein